MSKGPAELADDILHGAEEIASFLGLQRRKIYHLIETNSFPHFRLGMTVCARRSTLLRWIEDSERNASAKSADAA